MLLQAAQDSEWIRIECACRNDARERRHARGFYHAELCSRASRTKLACRPAHSPADDAASESVDHERCVDEALPDRDIGGVRNPQPVRRRSFELALKRDPAGLLVRGRRADRLATNDALQAHQPCDSVPGDIETFTLHLPRGLTDTINEEALLEDTTCLDLQADIATGADRQTIHIYALGDIFVVG